LNKENEKLNKRRRKRKTLAKGTSRISTGKNRKERNEKEHLQLRIRFMRSWRLLSRISKNREDRDSSST